MITTTGDITQEFNTLPSTGEVEQQKREIVLAHADKIKGVLRENLKTSTKPGNADCRISVPEWCRDDILIELQQWAGLWGYRIEYKESKIVLTHVGKGKKAPRCPTCTKRIHTFIKTVIFLFVTLFSLSAPMLAGLFSHRIVKHFDGGVVVIVGFFVTLLIIPVTGATLGFIIDDSFKSWFKEKFVP